MAWSSSGRTNKELVNNMFRNGLIESEVVKNAMLEVDRAHYAPYAPYNDSPQPIGHGATISAPHMHAHAVEALLPALLPLSSTTPRRILDVGSGSGCLTHILGALVRQSDAPKAKTKDPSPASEVSRVVGIDHIPTLVQLSVDNMRKSDSGRKLLDDGTVVLVQGDGRKGCREHAPYDAIHVGAAAETWHDELLDQLKGPGRMFIPIDGGGGQQWVYLVKKNEGGKVSKEKLFEVRYVPLTDAPAGKVIGAASK